MPASNPTNMLYYGDNLEILREHIADAVAAYVATRDVPEA